MIELLFINAFFIVGLYEASEAGGILEKPHDFLERNLPEIIYKPILGCVYCMASVWGSLFFLFNQFLDFNTGQNIFQWYKLLYLPFYIAALSGFIVLIYGMILYLKR